MLPMKSLFTFENLPMTIILVLVAMAWISALSVILFH
jgi:hypothetical protein